MVRAAPLPADALLQCYAMRGDCYTDCFVVDLGRRVERAEALRAFYTTPLFRAERLVLRLIGRGGSDAQIKDLTQVGAPFAAWTVEAIATDQILMCDMAGSTRSWFAVDGDAFLFGSAVTPATPGQGLGMLFTALLPLHKQYARALLWSAARRLR